MCACARVYTHKHTDSLYFNSITGSDKTCFFQTVLKLPITACFVSGLANNFLLGLVKSLSLLLSSTTNLIRTPPVILANSCILSFETDGEEKKCPHSSYQP